MIPSLLLYLFVGALAPVTDVAGPAGNLIYWGAIAGILAYWLALAGRRSVIEGGVVIPAIVKAYIPVFLVLVAFEMRWWDPSFDLKDPPSLVLYFGLVPALLCALALRDDASRAAAHRTVRVAFFAASAAIIGWAIVAGVDWQRNYIALPGLHKNSVAASYEVVMLAAILGQPRARRVLMAGLGLGCLILIGSKTGLALMAGVMAVVLFGGFGAAVAAAAAVAGVWLLIPTFGLDSPVATLAMRFLLWAQAWDEITASAVRWWLGVGPGTFTGLLNLAGLGGERHPHNLVLQFWHGYGLVGLLLFLGFFGWLLRRFGPTRSPFLAAFWLFNLHALFDVGWVKGGGFVASAALGLGLADVLQRKAPAPPTPLPAE
jgi:O-antigen ligase